MTSHHSIEQEPEVYFVATTEGETNTPKLFQEAFEACLLAEIEPKKLSEEKCLGKNVSIHNDIYILDNFESKVYQFLHENKARVLGAPCVLYCLKNTEDLPNSEHPVYSMCMEGALVTLTGVPAAQRADAIKKVQWLGGTYTKSLVKSSTHLIAQEVSSKKYQAAVELGIPILTLEWLEDSYKKSKLKLFTATEETYLSSFICPPFLGCVVTCSGIKERDKIKNIIQQGGGTYTGQMTYKECTHLVLDKPEGNKYEMARKWGSICVVTPLWVYDCQKLGHKACEDSSVYSVIREVSTPRKHKVPLPSLSDVSAIHSMTLTSTHIDETMPRAGIVCHGVNITSPQGQPESLLTTPTARTSETVQVGDLSKSNDALLNIKICLKGYQDSKEEFYNKLIKQCNGTQSMSIVNADYIIAPSLSSSIREHSKHIRVPIISGDWLSEVYEKQTLVDTRPYRLDVAPKRLNSSYIYEDAPSAKRQAVMDDSTLLLDTEVSKTAVPTDDQLIREYTGISKESPSVNKDIHQITDKNKHSKESTSSKMIFHGKKFRLMDLSPEHSDTASVKIKSNGGHITQSDADYYVLPFIIPKYPVASLSTIVSIVWIRACDRSGTFLDPASNPLFKPIIVRHPSVMCGCVLTTTGLTALERDALSELMKETGGVYVEELRRYPALNVPATTHLICNSTESAKYKAAKNWGITITNIRWVLGSIQAGVVQPADKYLATESSCDMNLNEKPTNERRTLASLKTPLNNRVQALQLDTTPSTGKKLKSPYDKQFLSTSILDNPEKTVRIDIEPGAFDTPNADLGQQTNKSDTPLDEALNKYLDIAVGKHYISTPEAATDVLSNTSVCISKNLASSAKELSAVAKSLGAQVSNGYDSSATHFIFKGKPSNGEYKTAKRHKQHIVSPYWLNKCKEVGQRVDESLYPYNFELAKELTSCKHLSNDSPIKTDDQCMESEPSNNKLPSDKHSKSESNGHQESDISMTDALQTLQQIEHYRKRCIRNSIHSGKIDSVSRLGKTIIPSKLTYDIAEDGFEPCYSQTNATTLVTWKDETSRCEQRKTITDASYSDVDSEVFAQIADEFTQQTKIEMRNPEKIAENQTAEIPNDCHSSPEKMEHSMLSKSSQKCFQFSGFSNKERDELAEKLRSLGAECIIASSLDIRCTHIIFNEPVRNEKFLCSLVLGLWLLNKSYVTACVEANCLVDEDAYEWGGSVTDHLRNENSSIAPYAKAAHRRRLLAQSGHYIKPFAGWQVILGLSSDKRTAMQRVLELGGATILVSGGLPDTPSKATHAFIDLKSGFSITDIEMLHQAGVKCLKPEYIPAFLVAEKSFNEIKFTCQKTTT